GRSHWRPAFHPEPICKLGYLGMRGRGIGRAPDRARKGGPPLPRLERGPWAGFRGWLVRGHDVGRISKTCSDEAQQRQRYAQHALTARECRSPAMSATKLPGLHYRHTPGASSGARIEPFAPAASVRDELSRAYALLTCSYQWRRLNSPG